MIYNGSFFSIYFGDASDALYQSYYFNLPDTAKIVTESQFANAQKQLECTQFMFLRQTHSADGLQICEETARDMKPFCIEGDFLITEVLQLGIGVMTADCLPVVLTDERNKVVAIVHAGWKGAMSTILSQTVSSMRRAYNTQIKDLEIFFGPSAKACCYEVSNDFVYQYAHIDMSAFIRQEQQWYFDLPNFCKNQLTALNVHVNQIDMHHNICTICHQEYFSHRRQKELAGRQMTVVALHKGEGIR
jgi:YfiH family protein